MINAYLFWRFVKFLSLCVLAGGVFSGVFSNPREKRMRALVFTNAGLFGVWFCGYALLKLSERALFEAWVLGAIAASVVLLWNAAQLAHARQAGRFTAGVALAALFFSVGVMSLRVVDPLSFVALATLAGAVAFLVASFTSAGDDSVIASPMDPATRVVSWNWFQWLARLEGLSLILMLFVSMPLRRLAGISLDGGTGLLAWAHGALFLFYLQALYSSGSLFEWSWKRRVLGFVLGLVPGGTFYFEYLVRPSSEAFADDRKQSTE